MSDPRGGHYVLTNDPHAQGYWQPEDGQKDASEVPVTDESEERRAA